jgi:GT2 family glycosyltransferase
MNEAHVAVSVVIPTYNRAASLDRLLTALEAQEPVPGGHEVIVVDDGSTDDTPAVVARHATVRCLRQQNAGPAAARNRGWRDGSAPLVAFTDDDTVPERAWLVDLTAAFEAQPSLDAVGGRIDSLDGGFLADFVQLEGQVHHKVQPDGDVLFLVTANSAWRREALTELGGFDESFSFASGEDTDLSLRAVRRGFKLAVVDAAGVRHEHRATLSRILATYHKHGRTRGQAVGPNPGSEWGGHRAAVLGPREWAARFRRYRASGCAIPEAALYVGLRFLGLIFYAVGIARSRLSRVG